MSGPRSMVIPRRVNVVRLLPVDKHVELWLLDDYFSNTVKIMSEDGELLETITCPFAFDNLHYDRKNKEWWTNKEDTVGTDNYVYRLSRNLKSLLSTNISDVNYECEAVCYDPSNDDVWVMSDDTGNQVLQLRDKADPTSVITSIDLNALGVLGPQDICYDSSDDTLWIADNDSTSNPVGRIYHLDKVGNLLSTHVVATTDHATLASKIGLLQGISYDYRDDTLWFTVRNNYIYHVDKSWNIIKILTSPFTGTPPACGPTGIEVVPWGTRTVLLDPMLSLRLYDNAANTVVAAQVGANTALSGGDNTSVKSGTGPINKAFTFNGSDDYIAISPTLVGSTGWSVSCWVKFTATIASEIILGDGAANEDWIRITDNNTIAIKINNVSSSWDPGFTMSLNEWHHLVFNYNSADNKIWLYYDGVLQTLSGSFAPVADFTPTTIGNKQTEWFGGSLSNVLFFNYLLNEREIAYLYNDGDGTDELEETVTSYLRTNINKLGYPLLS